MKANILYKIYFSLPDDNYLGIASKVVNRVIGKILKKSFDKYLPKYYKKSANNTNYCLLKKEKQGQKLIVSLTSFPGRIKDVWLCIESLMRQTIKPDMIVLWLAESQFPNKILPETLTNLIDRGLTIRWCEEDLRSHKKYYYAMQEFPNDYIVLFDDDFYYPDYVFENIIKMQMEHPDSICATRVHKMTYTKGDLNPYRKWIHNYTPQMKESKNLFFTSGAGTLFPPHIMPKETFDKTVFKEICFFADDVWLNILAVKNDITVVSNGFFNKDAITASKTQEQKLVSTNVFMGGNDKQIKDVCEYFQIDLSSLP